MMPDTVLHTALSGALERHPDGWRWKDGTPEPRARDMLLQEVAPNFRCCAGMVEIPWNWREARFWPAGRIDTQAAQEIENLIQEGGRKAGIYAEGLAEALDDHRLTKHGYVIPIALWDAVMREHCGCWWDSEHEADILARARS